MSVRLWLMWISFLLGVSQGAVADQPNPTFFLLESARKGVTISPPKENLRYFPLTHNPKAAKSMTHPRKTPVQEAVAKRSPKDQSAISQEQARQILSIFPMPD